MLSVFVFAASRTNASSLAHIRHNISVCAQHTRATTHATSLNTEAAREKEDDAFFFFLGRKKKTTKKKKDVLVE